MWPDTISRKHSVHSGCWAIVSFAPPLGFRILPLGMPVSQRSSWIPLTWWWGIVEPLENHLPKSEIITDNDYEEQIINAWLDFLRKLLHNKSLIILTQQNYINRTFSDFNQIEDLEDTNTPWEWYVLTFWCLILPKRLDWIFLCSPYDCLRLQFHY